MLNNPSISLEIPNEIKLTVETFVHGELATIIGDISAQAAAATGTTENCEITDPIRLELTTLLGGIAENTEGETE
jgi:hypothetical protein